MDKARSFHSKDFTSSDPHVLHHIACTLCGIEAECGRILIFIKNRIFLNTFVGLFNLSFRNEEIRNDRRQDGLDPPPSGCHFQTQIIRNIWRLNEEC